MIGLVCKLSDEDNKKMRKKNERVPIVCGTIAIAAIASERIETSEQKKKKKSTTLTLLLCLCECESVGI